MVLQADLSDSNIIASYVHLIDSLNGIIIASKDQKKRILRTFNGGKNWITIYSSPNNKEKYSSISFADKNNGVIIGIEETLQPINNFNIFIFKTSNGGIIWDKKIVKSLKTSVGAYIAYPDVKNCFILYNNNQMMKSTDGGNTWSSEIIPINNHSISAMHFIDAQTTYLVGYRSEIISNVDANNSILLHDEVGYYKSVRFSLTQNYPNPFNPSTKIKYSLPKQGMVTIKVYDVLGKEVVQIVDEEKNPGEYEINFNGNGLSSGIYFYQIQAGEFIQTKKMVLMK